VSGQDPERPASSAWEGRRERGSRLALGFLVWGIRSLGHRRLRVLLAPIAAYYCFIDGPARRASQAYLARIWAIQGRSESPRLRDTYRHLYRFAQVILDRLSLWSGSIDEFRVELHGREHMEQLAESKQGAFLVGAHLGSFDVLRVVAREADIPVNVVMYSANATKINEAFEVLDPNSSVRIIGLDPGAVTTGFGIRSGIERGEFVATLGDRLRPGAKDRVAYANFLGARAAFPQGPFLLPMVIGTPVLLTIAIRTGPLSYDIYLEPIADGRRVAAACREAAVQEQVEHFAARLEHYCMKDPLQWFNFYDFWAEVEHAER
jgi:predicted LPLAT superfamily acyltransferase